MPAASAREVAILPLIVALLALPVSLASLVVAWDQLLGSFWAEIEFGLRYWITWEE